PAAMQVARSKFFMVVGGEGEKSAKKNILCSNDFLSYVWIGQTHQLGHQPHLFTFTPHNHEKFASGYLHCRGC
ncbi:MAG: hypothetical protein M3Y54_08570, partial [Bacteroidota bacterium]|nr:hypothetical protein [Bacteroidota bacterium]